MGSSTRSAQAPLAQPGLDPGGQRTDTLFPTEAGRLACPHPGSGAPPHPPRGRKAWGSTHNADPHSCSGAAGSSGPLSRQTLGFGCEMEKRTGGRARWCRGLHPERASPGGWACLAGRAPNQSGCRRTQDSLSLGAPPDPRVLALGRSPPQGPTRCPPAKQSGPQCRRPRPAVRSPQRRAHRPLQLWTLLASLSVRSRPRTLLPSHPRGPPGWAADLRSTRDRVRPAGLGASLSPLHKLEGLGAAWIGPRGTRSWNQDNAKRAHRWDGVHGCPCSLRRPPNPAQRSAPNLTGLGSRLKVIFGKRGCSPFTLRDQSPSHPPGRWVGVFGSPPPTCPLLPIVGEAGRAGRQPTQEAEKSLQTEDLPWEISKPSDHRT